jgi:cbb3-type cytochrome oxidase maturation protein
MFILIGCSLLLAIGFLSAFIWSVKSGQMDDDYTPSVRIRHNKIKLLIILLYPKHDEHHNLLKWMSYFCHITHDSFAQQLLITPITHTNANRKI